MPNAVTRSGGTPKKKKPSTSSSSSVDTRQTQRVTRVETAGDAIANRGAKIAKRAERRTEVAAAREAVQDARADKRQRRQDKALYRRDIRSVRTSAREDARTKKNERGPSDADIIAGYLGVDKKVVTGKAGPLSSKQLKSYTGSPSRQQTAKVYENLPRQGNGGRDSDARGTSRGPSGGPQRGSGAGGGAATLGGSSAQRSRSGGGGSGYAGAGRPGPTADVNQHTRADTGGSTFGTVGGATVRPPTSAVRPNFEGGAEGSAGGQTGGATNPLAAGVGDALAGYSLDEVLHGAKRKGRIRRTRGTE